MHVHGRRSWDFKHRDSVTCVQDDAVIKTMMKKQIRKKTKRTKMRMNIGMKMRMRINKHSASVLRAIGGCCGKNQRQSEAGNRWRSVVSHVVRPCQRCCSAVGRNINRDEKSDIQ